MTWGEPLGTASAAEARAAIDEILASSGFHHTKSAFAQLLESVFEWLSDLLPGLPPMDPDTLGNVLLALAWVALGVVVLLVLRALWPRWRRREAGRADVAADPEAERRLRVARLRAQARDAAARGEHLLALRLEFTALVVGLGERGDLEYKDAFTNRELLERGHPGAEAERVLRPLVPELDRKSFGGEPAGADDVARLAALCDRLLGGVRA